jgi:hypothetical protein
VVADDPAARKAAERLRPNHASVRPIRKSYEFGARTIRWTAEDADDDRLSYSLEIRREPDGPWFPLARDLEEEFHSWDSRSLRDGTYRARLTVDDHRDNPSERTLRHGAVSDPFEVDNTRPAVDAREQRLEDGVTVVSFEALDPGGRIESVEASVDGEPWRMLAPVDGVADSSTERYEIRVPGADDGTVTRTLRLRVTDGVGNQGGGLWTIETPPGKRRRPPR